MIEKDLFIRQERFAKDRNKFLIQRHLQQGNPRPGKGEEEGAGDVVEACLPSGFEARGDETAIHQKSWR